MTASPTRRQLVFLLGSLLLAPLVTLYATQAVWLQSLWAPLPWMASHGGATVLFWVLFSSLSLTLYGFFRRLFPAYLPEVAVFMGVAVTSRYKLDINGAPLQLSDFAFVGNLGDITGYAASQLIPTLTTLLAIGVAAVLTETLRRKETWRPSLTQGFVLGSLCLTLFLSALYPGALQSAALRLDQNSPDQETRNERMGVVQTGKTHTVDPADQGAADDSDEQKNDRIGHALVHQHTCKAGCERCVSAYGKVDAGGDQAEQHAGGNQCIERRLLENGHHVRILKEVRRCDCQNYTKDYQCAKRTSISHQIAGFLRFSHLIYLPKLPS